MIESLENNEQILLMYVADELPADDRAEVEQMLTADGSLRRELDRLRLAHEVIAQKLAILDEVAMPAVSSDVLVRRVGREMRQRLAQTKAPVTVANETQPHSRSWRWWHPTAAAAAIAILAMIWVERQSATRILVRTGPANHHQVIPSEQPNESPLPELDNRYALFENSWQSTTPTDQPDAKPASDDEPQAIASGSPVVPMPQDDLSQFLLSAGSVQQ